MSEEIKKAYQEKMEAQIKEWANKIENLKIKAEKLSAEAKTKILDKVEKLNGKLDESKEDLGKLKNSNEDTWQNIKDKMEGLSDGIKKGIDDLLSRF